MSSLAIWHVAREYAGVAAAGGMNKVIAGLSEALVREGQRVTAVLPFYGFLRSRIDDVVDTGLSLDLVFSAAGTEVRHRVRVFSLVRQGVRVFLLDSEVFSGKLDIYVYTGRERSSDPAVRFLKGQGHSDFDWMNLILQHGMLELAMRLGEIPDVIHGHDGHTAFIPSLIRHHPRYREAFAHTRALVTIHNAGDGYHQEIDGMSRCQLLTGLPESVLKKGLIFGRVDPFLLAGADGVLSTVSPGYAAELLSERGRGLSGGLGSTLASKGISLYGFYNGIDEGEYRFRHDFGFVDTGRQVKKALRKSLAEEVSAGVDGLTVYGGLYADLDGPLFTGMSRITGQKGIELLASGVSRLLKRESSASFLFMGQGEPDYEALLVRLSEAFPGRVLFLNGYHPRLERDLFVAGDFFLIPSRYEPCGLSDLIALLAGNLPVVRSVGGLKKVIDGYNGYAFRGSRPGAFDRVLDRAMRDYLRYPNRLTGMQETGLRTVLQDFSWTERVRDSYLPFYRGMLRAL